MPVTREKEVMLQAGIECVTLATRVVLSRKPPYGQTTEDNNPTTFTTSIRPSQLLLSTRMVVTLNPTSHGTQVVARTASQWFILGDVFDYYNKYISDFFEALDAVVQMHGARNNKANKPDMATPRKPSDQF